MPHQFFIDTDRICRVVRLLDALRSIGKKLEEDCVASQSSSFPGIFPRQTDRSLFFRPVSHGQRHTRGSPIGKHGTGYVVLVDASRSDDGRYGAIARSADRQTAIDSCRSTQRSRHSIMDDNERRHKTVHEYRPESLSLRIVRPETGNRIRLSHR